MAPEVALPELLSAGQLLFGPSFRPENDWQTELRGAWRRRALETHPDRAEALGRPAAVLALEFHAVQEAYATLSRARPVPRAVPRQRPAARAACHEAPATSTPRQPGHPASASPAPKPSASASARKASTGQRYAWPVMPARPLRFGELLYYSGRVAFSELVAAVVWQRRQRPNLGDLALQLGYLSPAQVTEILERRRQEAPPFTLFGDFAVSAGFLSPFQRMVLVGLQRRLQRPIGEFFVAEGLLDAGEVGAVRQQVFTHNALHRDASAAWAA